MKKQIIAGMMAAALACSMIPSFGTEAAGKKKAMKAYQEWITTAKSENEYIGNYNGFQIVYIDDDAIPELVAAHIPKDYMDNNGVYEYCLVTYTGGKVVKVRDFQSGVASAGGYRGDTAFIPKENKLYEGFISSGSGEGEDIIYQLKKGALKKKVGGKYSLATESYQWAGEMMGQSEYYDAMDEVFPSDEAKSFESLTYISKKKMLKKLK